MTKIYQFISRNSINTLFYISKIVGSCIETIHKVRKSSTIALVPFRPSVDRRWKIIDVHKRTYNWKLCRFIRFASIRVKWKMFYIHTKYCSIKAKIARNNSQPLRKVTISQTNHFGLFLLRWNDFMLILFNI